MDRYLKLTAAENLVYNREFESIAPEEREAVMQLTNEWIEQGIEQGIERGIVQGARRLVLRQLEHRFGPVPAPLRDRIGQLGEPTIERLAEALLDFRDLADAEAWVTQTR